MDGASMHIMALMYILANKMSFIKVYYEPDSVPGQCLSFSDFFCIMFLWDMTAACLCDDFQSCYKIKFDVFVEQNASNTFTSTMHLPEAQTRL